MRGVSRTRKLLAAIRAGDGAPTGLGQDLTSGAFQNHYELSDQDLCNYRVNAGM